MASNTSGTKYRFLTEPDDALKCLICLEVAEGPWQHEECGRLFCKECLDKHGRDNPCPNCRMEQPQYFRDNKSKREIKSLPVKCQDTESCTWEGTIGTLEEHLATCQFTLTSCPKGCIDDEMNIKCFPKKDIESHLAMECPYRDYACTHKGCTVNGTQYYITQVHDETCEKKIVPCTNIGCCKKMQRQHLSQHVKSECEHTVIACKHKSIGCEIELKRKDMPAHELDDKLHLHMAINTITELKQYGDITLKQEESISIKCIDYQVKKEGKKELISPSFYTSHGYHMAIKVQANGCGAGRGTHLSVFAHIMA